MAEEATTPAGEAQAPQTEAPSINTNQAAEAPAQPAETPKAPDLHGFTEEQLADMAKFYAANGGYEKVKSRLSNPEPKQPEAQTQPTQPTQGQNEQQVQQTQTKLRDGFASPKQLAMIQYFENLAARPEYENISEQIKNLDVVKEAEDMGMTLVDDDYNVNIKDLTKFLALKSASVPAKPTSVEPTNTPTVDYVPVEGDTITSINQALDIVRQSTALKAQGQQPHPAEAKALEYLKANKFGQ